MKMGDQVIIGFISPGQVDAMFSMRVTAIFRERRDRVADCMTDESSGLLSRARNQLVSNFLTHPSRAEWLLMIDADQQLAVEDFDKLIAAAHDTERPIVAGLYFGAWSGEFFPTPVPLIFDAIDGTHRFRPIQRYPRDQVIPVESAGTGCLLVHRSVFEKIANEDGNKQHTWARYEDGSTAPRWCWFQDMPVNGDWFSEDHYFCARARQAGFKLHAHTGVVLPHRKQFWLDERHHLLNHPDMLTEDELRTPRWSALAGVPELAAKRAETAEHKPANERAVKPRPKRGRR